jgi:nucleoid-associated protein YgaU
MVIYDANHNQIRNPDRIYPGQVLLIPSKAQR